MAAVEEKVGPSTKVCLAYQTGRIKSGKKRPCAKWSAVKFKSTLVTSSDGQANNTKTILSDEGDNEGKQIGSIDINGKITIKKGDTNLDLNENQSSNRRQLIKYIKELQKQGKVVDMSQWDDLTAEQQLALNKSTKQHNNAATNDQTDETSGIANDDLPDADFDRGFSDLANISVEGRNARETYGNYYYPADLQSNKQDRVKFTMGYSEGTEVEASLVNQKSFQKKYNTISGSVTLPIVTGISDQSSVDWKGAEITPLQSFAAAGALDLFNEAKSGKSLSQIGSSALNIGQEAVQGLADSGMGDAINVWLAQKAVGAQNLLSRTTGAIVNPNLEMLFNAPQLRNFGFTFLLSPRDADEANQVRKIIRFFKQGMSVKTTASNVFLKAPNIFKIKYMTFNTDGTEILHPSINIIKTCALLSMDVQYTPAGTYMTYEDPYRTMTAYQLTMQFGELDPIYDSDYTELDNDNDTVIGY